MKLGTNLDETTATPVAPLSGHGRKHRPSQPSHAPSHTPGRQRRSGGLWGRLLTGFLQRSIVKGKLILILPDGKRHEFGLGQPSVTFEITERATLRRIALNPDLALGEAYMDGTLRVLDGDIHDLLELCLSNLGGKSGSRLRKTWSELRRLAKPLTLFNPVRRSRRNVAHHYDLSDELYELFLDSDRQYSCAYYQSPDQTLEQAQAQKKRHIAAKLLLEPGQRVLDIGSGWGGLARSLAADNAVDVTGLTLSAAQLAYANEQTRAAGLDDRVRFYLRDYRHERARYDRIVSVGMFEHVGPAHYATFFNTVAERLSQDGVALVHTIGTSSGPCAPGAWINKYIFPGGYVPSLSEVLPAIENSGLIVTDIEVLRLHYAETLRAWRQRFMANRREVAEIYDERFCLMWEFYLASCEAGFRHNGLEVFQIQLALRNDTVPLTRDYIAAKEHLKLAVANQTSPSA
ncbi:MAG: class I SAM-dependent methyltransferase [Halocynthiibacter sp.]